MSEVIPEKYADLFEKKAFGNLGTLMKDGSPQVTPVWVDFDGQYVRFNSAKGRVKDKNIRRDPRVGVLVDTYVDDWSLLWWVRMRGTARILTEGDERERAVNALRGKYPQYREQPLDDAVVAIDVEEWVGWSAT